MSGLDDVYDVRPAGKPKGDRGSKGAGKKADLKTWVRQHQPQVLGGGAAAVALLALVMKRRASSDTAGPTTRVVPPAYSYGDPQDFRGAAGAGVYDSTASDVYNSLQPQLEQVQRMVEGLADLQPGTAPVPVVQQPTPSPGPAAPPVNPGSSYAPYVPPAPAPAPVAKPAPKPKPAPAPKPTPAPRPPRFRRPPAPKPAPVYRHPTPVTPPPPRGQGWKPVKSAPGVYSRPAMHLTDAELARKPHLRAAAEQQRQAAAVRGALAPRNRQRPQLTRRPGGWSLYPNRGR